MKWNGTPLTDNEKLMIVNVYNYFSNDNSRTDDHRKLTLRKRVAEVLGLGSMRKDSCKRNFRLLLRVLHRLEYYFGQGDCRNILHESPNNVAYRCRYLCFHFANLEDNNDVPRHPEVFLDESYCYLHHTSRNTWVPHQGVILVPGHGPLVVIFGAIVVFRNGSSNKLYDANIAPNQVDYHGNFNAEIFEDLFSTLCKILYENYGPVSIHMDGASYHKSDLKRPELLELVQINKEKVPFSCIKIAEQYELKVSFTPPYHCELQPIEGVWAVVKGEVARSGSHPNLLSVRNTLLDAFKKKVTSQVIIGLWRRALKNAKKYLESDEDSQLIDDELDEYSSSDKDHVI
ncbi:unnamed protein product [Rhizophagus irregularis]|nr:unnamed protein product [Rhizophagus irregularis]